MYIRVTVTGDKVWKNKLTYLSKNIGRIAVKPAFQDLEGKLMRTLDALFKPSKGKGKLGVQRREAFAIAKSVAKHGIGRQDGDSPLPRELPTGQSRIAFPTWVVTVKNKKDIESLAAKVGGLAVTYLDK